MKRILGFLFLLLIFVGLLTGCAGSDTPVNETDNPQTQGEVQEMAVMVDGVLYYNTYQAIGVARCGVMDGEINSTVSQYRLPSVDGQSNFGTGYEYQYADENHIDIPMANPDGWIRFCNMECDTDHTVPAVGSCLTQETDNSKSTENSDNLCGYPTKNRMPTPPADHTGSWFCMPYEIKITVKNTANTDSKAVSDDDGLAILAILSEENWDIRGTSDCMNNIEISVNDVRYYYHFDCGTFNDNTNQRSLHLNDSDKEEINSILSKYTSTASLP